MLNQVILVGRVTNDLVLKENESGVKYCDVSLAVPRSYKNSEGLYDTDFIHVTVFSNTAGTAVEYCRKGDLIGVKGRLQRYAGNDYTANGMPVLQVVAEKVTFLSSRKDNE